MSKHTRAVVEQTIPVRTHGRYLVSSPADRPAPMFVGFHGYMENAAIQMERLEAVAGSERWTCLAVQGLHRFYLRRTSTVVASWMTSQDRELAIADNCAYVRAVVEHEWAARRGVRGVVYVGFSQGVAMAFRAAVRSERHVLGVIAVGGDIPPEIDRGQLAAIGHVLLCHGAKDDWYTAEKLANDVSRLRDAVVPHTVMNGHGGHEWGADVSAAVAAFLDQRWADGLE